MIRSPIKWAGGKTRVMPQLLEHLPKADCLIEPFVGSGTVFMNTEYRRYILCDSNRALINFFRVVTMDTERLINITRSMFHGDNTEDRYYARRTLFNSMQWSDTSRPDQALLYAALFLYLNRHGFNGLYRTNLRGNLTFHSVNMPRLTSLKRKCAYSPKRPITQTPFSSIVIFAIPFATSWNWILTKSFTAIRHTFQPVKPPTSPLTVSHSPWTIIVSWLKPCWMSIASMASARSSQTATRLIPAKFIPPSTFTP